MTRKSELGSEGRVFLKKDGAGNWRARWYGRWMVEGKSRETSLCVWQGTPPENPAKEEGNATFEQSRERARKQLKEAIERRHGADEELRDAQKVHALRYGYKVVRVKIADLAALWDKLPHKADMTEGRRERVHCVLNRFRDFMRDHFPTVTDAGALSAEHFQAFLADVDKQGIPGKPKKGKAVKAASQVKGIGVSARTWNDVLEILRGVLRKVDGNSRGFREYLANLPKKTEKTIHRRPFEESELNAIFAAAAEVDPELRPAIVAAACTALRRGDVCRMRWDAVDLAEGFATVKTFKTGETVEIPIFPPFRAVLEDAAAKRKKGVPYVWPEIALAYARNADGLNVRLRRVLAAAGFVRPERVQRAAGKYPAPEDETAAATMLEDGMARQGWTDKRRDKARRILALHFQGRNGKEIAEEIGTSKGAVSDYLHEMEDAAGIALVSPPKRDTLPQATLAEPQDGEQRKQRGSLCGWHSFRTTFCTLALANGVPMELLQKITGHRTAEIVLKYYNRPGREAIRRAIGNAMPKALAGAVGENGKREGKRQKSAKVKTGVKADVDFEAVALPPGLAALLDKATPEQLEEVAKMLKRGGGK